MNDLGFPWSKFFFPEGLLIRRTSTPESVEWLFERFRQGLMEVLQGLL